MKLATWILIFALAPAAVGQNTEPAQSERKIFTIQHADVTAIARVLKVFGNVVSIEPGLKIIVVSGPPTTIASMESAVQKLDVPPAPEKNVELTFQIIRADTGGADTTQQLPEELRGVARNLTATFGFQHYELLETVQLRGRDSQRAGSTGAAGWGGGTYAVQATPQISVTAKGNVVRLSDLQFQVVRAINTGRVDPANNRPVYTDRRTNISTDIDVLEGQKVVVGKTNIDSINGVSGNIVLVVSAKVVD